LKLIKKQNIELYIIQKRKKKDLDYLVN
jgi:hypothetical protein